MDTVDIDTKNRQFEQVGPERILDWTWSKFGANAAASSSFQTQSLPLLHMISRVCPKLPVIFLDTGFHFPETLAFRDTLQEKLGLNIINVKPAISKKQLFDRFGKAPYAADPDWCCYVNKVKPMEEALKANDIKGWISGVRRDQTDARKSFDFLELQSSGRLKIHPMLEVTERQIWTYIDTHDLPAHPLFSKGYFSVGCAPCTRAVDNAQDARSGRWAGKTKTECGLHTNTIHRDDQVRES